MCEVRHGGGSPEERVRTQAVRAGKAQGVHRRQRAALGEGGRRGVAKAAAAEAQVHALQPAVWRGRSRIRRYGARCMGA